MMTVLNVSTLVNPPQRGRSVTRRLERMVAFLGMKPPDQGSLLVKVPQVSAVQYGKLLSNYGQKSVSHIEKAKVPHLLNCGSGSRGSIRYTLTLWL